MTRRRARGARELARRSREGIDDHDLIGRGASRALRTSAAASVASTSASVRPHTSGPPRPAARIVSGVCPNTCEGRAGRDYARSSAEARAQRSPSMRSTRRSGPGQGRQVEGGTSAPSPSPGRSGQRVPKGHRMIALRHDGKERYCSAKKDGGSRGGSTRIVCQQRGGLERPPCLSEGEAQRQSGTPPEAAAGAAAGGFMTAEDRDVARWHPGNAVWSSSASRSRGGLRADERSAEPRGCDHQAPARKAHGVRREGSRAERLLEDRELLACRLSPVPASRASIRLSRSSS